MTTPALMSYADFLKQIKPSMLDANGAFRGPTAGVNYQMEGLTPQEYYDHLTSQYQYGVENAKDVSNHTQPPNPADFNAALNPNWQAGPKTMGDGFFGGYNDFLSQHEVIDGVAAVALGGLGANYFDLGGAPVDAGADLGFSGIDTGAYNPGLDSSAANVGGTGLPSTGATTGTLGSGTYDLGADIPDSASSVINTGPTTEAIPSTTPVGPPTGGGATDAAGHLIGDGTAVAGTGSSSFVDLVKNHFIDPATGAINWANVIKGGVSALGAVAAYQQAQQNNSNGANNGGYNGTITPYSAQRAAVPVPANYRPGAGGIRYLTDVAYNGSGAEGAAAQQAAVANQQSGLAAQNQVNVNAQNAATAAAKAQYASTHGGLTMGGAGGAGGGAGQPPGPGPTGSYDLGGNAAPQDPDNRPPGSYDLGGNAAPQDPDNRPPGSYDLGGNAAPQDSGNTPAGNPAPNPGTPGAPSNSGGTTMPSTPPNAGHGDGMYVQGQYITKAQLQHAFASGVNPVQYLQQLGVTDQGQIHDLVTQAEYIAGNAPTGDAALQNAFKQYQQYNPNGKFANDFAGWKKDVPADVLNAISAGTYTGSTATASADFGPGGIYGPGSAYYGQAGYANGLGPRGMGDLGGGWGATGAASGGNGQLTPAQQQAVMEAAAAGQPRPNFANGQTPVTSAQIQAFYQQHANDPAAIQAAMTQYHVTPQQAAAATGQSVGTFTAPGAVQATEGTGPPGQPGVSASDIASFYAAHANDPAAIQAAMAQYKITPQQAAAATGQAVSVFQPQGALQSQSQAVGGGAAAAAAPAAPQPAISNDQINTFYQQHQGDQAAIKAAMQQYGVTADQAAAATGHNASDFQFARGGLTSLAAHRVGGQYLRGNTDGMADQIPAVIDHKQPAALAHGEFVWPADVVSDLGNGNSDAGAQVLHQAMDKIRMARHGTKQQGKRINPHAFMPGGLAKAFAAGGGVRHFDTGGTTAPQIGQAAPGVSSTSSTLSNWVAPYVTDMLSKGQALANTPYQQYPGQLTADATGLQNQAFQSAGDLQTPGVIAGAADNASLAANRAGNTNYAPSTFTAGDFTAPGVSQQFMSPYEDNVIQQQQRDAQRAADIATTYRQGDQTKQGGFGGSRAAIMDSEAARNLALQKGDIATTGLQAAYTAGQNQFNTQQQNQLNNNQATEASKQFGANLGLQGLNTQINAANTAGNLGALWNTTNTNNINTQLQAGGVQQGITQAGLTADQNAFNQERQNPYTQLTFQQSLLNGLPISTQNNNVQTNPLAAAANTATGLNSLITAFTGP